jgi:hypothetical protein
MWIVLNDAFLSIVDQKAADGYRINPSPAPDDILVVRARVKGDIERVFGNGTRVHSIKGRDYLFRAFITRQQVQDAIMCEIMTLDYGNFKNSVREDDRHDAYADIWGIMYRFQGDRAARGHKPAYQRRYPSLRAAY